MKYITIVLGLMVSTVGYARVSFSNSHKLGSFERLEGYFLNSAPVNWNSLGKGGGTWEGRCFAKGDATGVSVEHIFAERDNGPLLEPTKLIFRRFENEPWTNESIADRLESEHYIIRKNGNALVIRGILDDSQVYYCSARCIDGYQTKCKPLF